MNSEIVNTDNVVLQLYSKKQEFENKYDTVKAVVWRDYKITTYK